MATWHWWGSMIIQILYYYIDRVHPVLKRYLALKRFDTDGQRETLKIK
jgi:hypothetical protein